MNDLSREEIDAAVARVVARELEVHQEKIAAELAEHHLALAAELAALNKEVAVSLSVSTKQVAETLIRSNQEVAAELLRQTRLSLTFQTRWNWSLVLINTLIIIIISMIGLTLLKSAYASFMTTFLLP